MMSDARLAAEIGGEFDHVLVDEYQDTNVLQARDPEVPSPRWRGVTVVGDDAQAIYSFRAATVDNILGFPDQYVRRTAFRRRSSRWKTTTGLRRECSTPPMR